MRISHGLSIFGRHDSSESGKRRMRREGRGIGRRRSREKEGLGGRGIGKENIE